MKKLLERAAGFTLAFIEENIRKGIDYDGKKFHYSEKSFFRPYDPELYAKLKPAMGGAADLADVVHSNKTGKLGFIIHGYGKFKKFVNPQAAGDFLTWSGKMLQDMNIIKVTDSEAVIGFSDPKQAEKAYWFNVSGVGRSRKLWKFLGITKKQEEKLIKDIKTQYISLAVKELGKVIAKNN